MLILPKFIYKFNAILITVPTDFFCGHWEADSKICMEMQRPKNILDNLEE